MLVLRDARTTGKAFCLSVFSSRRRHTSSDRDWSSDVCSSDLALLLGFGHLRSVGPALLLLLAAGFAQNVAMISMTATLITAAGGRFRGRVMGVRTLAVYGLPLGLMASGALIERIGYPLTISVSAAVGLLFTLLIGIKWRASMWERSRVATA